MVFSSGCYYGVLNVIDPTIRYDANGKIIGALPALPPASETTHDNRNGQNGTRDQQADQREVVVVETVESIHSRMDDSYQQGFHPHITYVSETDMMQPGNSADAPCLIEPIDERIVVHQDVPSEPEPIPELLHEPIQDDQPPQDQQQNNQENPQEVINVEEEPAQTTTTTTSSPPVEGGGDAPLPIEEPAAQEQPQVIPVDEPKKEETAPVLQEEQKEPESATAQQDVEPPVEAVTDPTPENVQEFFQPLEQSEQPDSGPTEAPAQEEHMEPSPVVDLVEEEEQQEEPAVVDLLEEEPEPVVNLVSVPTPPVVDLVKDPAHDQQTAESESEFTPEEHGQPIFIDEPKETLEEGAQAPELVEEPRNEHVTAYAESHSGKKPIFVVEEPKSNLEEEDMHSMVAVVDYMDATPLFKTIQRKNWQAVLFFLRTGSFSFSPLTGSAMTDAVQTQAQTWVSKKDEAGKELWRQLPLHAAICFGASQKVVEKLIIAYPEALKSPDCHGNLPLHLAYIFDADDTVLSLLMRTFPAALHVMNFQGLQPIQCSNEISSETFQYNAELFGALSDYTRAVAENDPEKLKEQLQEVRKQLKSVNDTLFAAAVPRKPEPIKEYMKSAPPPPPPAAVVEQEQRQDKDTAVVEYGFGPSAFFREVANGLCPGSRGQVEDEMCGIYSSKKPQSTPSNIMREPNEIIVLDDVPPPPRSCRVMEYCPKTKTWKEV